MVTVSPVANAATIVTDEFANLNAWTATRITLDTTAGSPSAPSARAQVTGQSASAYRDLGTTYSQACMSANVNLVPGSGSTVDLFRLRTAAGGPIIKVLVTQGSPTQNGTLQVRNDFGGTSINTNIPLGSGFQNVELCGGINTTWDLFRNGTEILSDWSANTGTTPIGRIQIGDTAAKTFTVNFDHVILDDAPGDGVTGDTTPPTAPGTPTGNSPTVGTIQIGWTAATDPAPASLPITYRVFEVVGGNNVQIGSTTTTSFTHSNLTSGSTHTYRVQAVDAANPPNVGPLSGTSASITVTSAPATGVVANWQMNEGSGATVMTDSGPNGITGAIGSAVVTGWVVDGATSYHWTNIVPNQPPAMPERLVKVSDSRINPGSRDYAVTVRFRTTRSFGNIIQKGQSTTKGGYFKWQIPNGQLTCLFRSRDQNGNLIGQNSASSPSGMPLNDGLWHTVRCEKTVDRVTMTIDGTTITRSSRRFIGPISNTTPLTLAGKGTCDQITVTCDYFVGDIDWVRIEASPT